MKDSIDFGSMEIPKLFRKLLIPTVLGMVFSAVFVITDGIFVGLWDGLWKVECEVPDYRRNCICNLFRKCLKISKNKSYCLLLADNGSFFLMPLQLHRKRV